MGKIAFTLLVSLLCSIGFSQSREVDSLKHQLSIVQPDTSRTMIMAELANLYKFSNPDSSLLYSQKALALARKIKFHKGEFQSLFMMGFTLDLMSNFSRSLEMQLKALRIAEKYRFTKGKGEVFNRFGVIYRETKDYPKSLTFHKQAKQLFDSIHLKDMSVLTETYIGKAFYYKGQMDSALYYCQMAYEHHKRWGLQFGQTANAQMLGIIQRKMGNIPLALGYFRQSLQDGLLFNEYFYNAQTDLEIAKIYQESGNSDSCVFYAQKSLADARAGNIYGRIVAANRFLSTLFEQTNAPLALQYHKTALAVMDSLHIFGNQTAIQNQFDFYEEERQYEIKTAQAAWRNQMRQYASLAGLGVFLLISFILYRNNHQKHKANVVLEKTLSTLRSTQAQLIQSEKLASLGELTAGIAHEIQNPLNFVNNFAEVSAEMLGEMKEEIKAGNTSEVIAIADDLEQNLSKINHHGQRASSIVKGMLEHSRASTGVKEPTDLNALADEYLRLAYHGLRAKDSGFNATLETHFDPDLPKVSVIPQDIGRVLVNLINNAFYAVAERSRSTLPATSQQHFPYQPTVTVSTQKMGNEVIIRVKDNGPGIPESIRDKIFQPFFTTKPTGQGTGLGLSLAYDIVTKGHGGTINCQSNDLEGTTFSISLPIPV